MNRENHWRKLASVGFSFWLVVSTPTAQGLWLAGFLLAPVAIWADEGTTVTPPTTTTFDTYLQQDQATTNFSDDSNMQVLSRNANRNRRAVVEFDLTTSGIPTTAAVKTSYLRLFMNDAPNLNLTHAAHLITGATSWTRTTVTWNNRTTGTPWGAAGGDFNATPASTQTTGTTDNVTRTWTIRSDGTVTNIPQMWLTSPATNQGLIIKDTAEGVGTSATARLAQYVNQNGNTPAEYPQLELRYLRDVTLNAPAAGISEVTWTWTFPVGSTVANYDGVMLIKKGGASQTFTFTPADGTAYVVGTDLGSGESVAANDSQLVTLTVTATDENGPDSVVLPATAYTYKALNHDATNIAGAASVTPPHYSTGVSANATTATGGGALKNWSYRTAAVSLSPPALDPGNVVVAGSNDFKLHSMSATNGRRNYQPAGLVGITGGVVQSRPVLIPAAYTSSPCACDVAYATSGDGRVYAFNSATGAQLWQSAVLGNAIVGSPSVQLAMFSLPSYPHAFDLVIVGTRNTADTTTNKIYGLNGNTGAIVWIFAPGNLDIISSTPILDYATNSVWVTSRAGAAGTQPSFWKLDTATTNAAGSLLNSVVLGSLAAGNRHLDASPEFGINGLYLFAVTTTGDLVAVDHGNPLNVFSINVGGSGMGFSILQPGTGPNDDDIYFTTSTGVHKRIFNRATQTFSSGWDTSVATLGGTPSAPIYTYIPLASFIFVGVSDGRFKKLNMATGSVDATMRTVNLGATIGDPSYDVILQRFYVGDSSGRIYSFDLF